MLSGWTELMMNRTGQMETDSVRATDGEDRGQIPVKWLQAVRQ